MEVCSVNCVQLERIYEIHLARNNLEHTEIIFEQFVQMQGKNTCPEHGIITYLDGKSRCSEHAKENDESDDDNVPYL